MLRPKADDPNMALDNSPGVNISTKVRFRDTSMPQNIQNEWLYRYFENIKF